MKTRLPLLYAAALPLSAAAAQSSLMLGLGVGSGAEYAGSDESETVALPAINWEWQRDDACAGGFGLHRAFAGVDGVGAAFWCAGAAAFTVNAGYDAGRDESASDHLDGLPDVDGGGSVGLGFTYGDDDGLTFGIEAASVDSDLVASAEIGYPLFDFIDAGIGINYADKGRMQKYFGVIGNTGTGMGETPMAGAAMDECLVATAGSTAGRYTTYCDELGGGIQSWTVSLSTFIPLPFAGDSWAASIGIDHTTLIGDAADSPLVHDKSDTFIGLTIVWQRER